MEEKILKALKSIGLTDNEIKIYTDLIQNDISSAMEISDRTKIYRTNVYDALKSLIEKGFVIETIEEKKKSFKAINPERIKDYLVQKEHEIDDIIPELLSLSRISEEKESVSISKGLFAMRNSFYDLLDLKQIINCYGISMEAVELVGKGFLDEFHKKRMKNKILMRHIYNQEAIERTKILNQMKFTEARSLSRKYDAAAPTNICGDTVIFFILSDPVSVIKIKSKKIADTYQRYFEILWQHAKK